MKAVRWHGRGDVRVDDVELAPPPPGWVQLDVAWCGICGSDLHEYLAGPAVIPTRRQPLSGLLAPPVTLGHEFSGRVAVLGDGVTTVAVGDRVAVDPCLRCGRCTWCVTGRYNICSQGGSVGLAADGALAERVNVPEYCVIAVPEQVPLNQAAVAEPLAVGVHAAARGDVGAGSRVCVIGAGPIGIACVLAARLGGAALVAVVEPSAHRRSAALAAGASVAYDPAEPDLRRTLFARTGRHGFDAVIEATGRPEQIDVALNATARGGTTVVAGVSEEPAAINPKSLVFFERSIVGALGYRHDIGRVLDLMAAGHLDTGDFVTARCGLADAADMIGDLARGRRLRELKVLVEIGGQ